MMVSYNDRRITHVSRRLEEAPVTPPDIDMSSIFVPAYLSYQNLSQSNFPPNSQTSTGALAFDRATSTFAYQNRTVIDRGRAMPPPRGDASEWIHCVSQTEAVLNLRDLTCTNGSIPPDAQGMQLTKKQCEVYAASLFSPLAFGDISSDFCKSKRSGKACELYSNASFVSRVSFDERTAELWSTTFSEQISPEQHTTAFYEFTVDRKANLLLAWRVTAVDMVTRGSTTTFLNSSIGNVFRGIVTPVPRSATVMPAGVQCQSTATATRSSPSVRVSKVLNYDTWPFGNSTPTDFQLWDWSKLTDVITPYSSTQRPEVAALAKQHNVKLITDWDTLLLTAKFISAGTVNEWSKWIDREVEHLVDGGMKGGVNIDIEHMSRTCKGLPPSCRERLSNFTCTLFNKIKSKAPSATLSSSLSLDPKDEQVGYDYATMAPCLDYFMPMAYSTADRTTPGSTLQLQWVNKSVAQYASMGIPANKLLPLLPWFGHNWPCKNVTNKLAAAEEEQVQHRIPVCDPLPIPPGPYRNRSAHPPYDVGGYHWEIGYGEALDLLDRHGPATFGPIWDPITASSVYEYVDRFTNTRHQVWFESPHSLQVKYDAFANAGCLGVGMWTGSSFHREDPAKNMAAAKAMWQSVPYR